MRDREPFGSWPPRPFAERSQIATELALLGYAAVATLTLLRLTLLALNVDHRLWIGRTIFRFTDPVIRILEFLPGADRSLVGNISLPDVTLTAIVALFPIVLLARARPGENL